jgi:hypothetical protein
MSVRQASEAYSVPISSLHNRLLKLNKANNVILAPGMCTFRMTSDEQEEDLVAYIKDLHSRLMFVLVFRLKSWHFLPFRLLPLAELNKTIQVASLSQGIN